jgi:hypothetical protein
MSNYFSVLLVSQERKPDFKKCYRLYSLSHGKNERIAEVRGPRPYYPRASKPNMGALPIYSPLY